jgi:hypothetical protein
MFYDGNIKTLLQKPQKADGVWKLKDMNQAINPTIPCLTCHYMHADNELLGRPSRLDQPNAISYDRANRKTSISWYVRDSKQIIRADKLLKIEMKNDGKPVKVADDAATRLCQQCHSPNFAHQTGSQDDRTPTGVHEGIACNACHSPHSNDARNSCNNCHPALSNCGLDVVNMNTTYLDINSPNNIHSVSCKSCHKNEEELRTKKIKKSV